MAFIIVDLPMPHSCSIWISCPVQTLPWLVCLQTLARSQMPAGQFSLVFFSLLPVLHRASFTSSWAGVSRCCIPACGLTAGTFWRRSPSCTSCMFSLLAAVCMPTPLQVSQAQYAVHKRIDGKLFPVFKCVFFKTRNGAEAQG